MTYEEYMNTLENQIKNKKAKDLVRQEFENHIEEQAESHPADGGSGKDRKGVKSDSPSKISAPALFSGNHFDDFWHLHAGDHILPYRQIL